LSVTIRTASSLNSAVKARRFILVMTHLLGSTYLGVHQN
jgi:hypothetical protein